jgi:NTE family protein
MEPEKRINLALQGGGPHGALARGALDRLLEDERIGIEGVVGTSAGAMNAAVLAYGLAVGGNRGAREKLREFWTRIGEVAAYSPLQPSWLDKATSPGNMDHSPLWMMFDAMTRFLSPYQFNPLNTHPLRDVLTGIVDFDRLRRESTVRLYTCAANVKSGRIRVFESHEMSIEAVLASACMPFMFQAVEVDGEHYWDGGYMGNPPIFPLIYNCESRDVLLVMINPIVIDEVPKTAQAILDRINTLSFNSSLMREMRAVAFVSKLIDDGKLCDSGMKRMLVHAVDGGDFMRELGVSSKLNPDWEFLTHLHDVGWERTDTWLESHFDCLGRDSTIDIRQKYL